jgi:two-component sensor histidine kinase
LAEYTRDLVRQIIDTNKPDTAANMPELDFGEGIGTGQVEFCVDFGLVLTELIINAYQHAGGPTVIGLRKANNTLIVEVRDSGEGFPADFDALSGSSLGFKIVSSVVLRRGGEIRIRPGNEGGVELSIPFPEANIR